MDTPRSNRTYFCIPGPHKKGEAKMEKVIGSRGKINNQLPEEFTLQIMKANLRSH